MAGHHPARSTRIIPYLTLAQLRQAHTLARQRGYPYQLEVAFVQSLSGGSYYPIWRYEFRPGEDYVRCHVLVGPAHNVRLDIESALFHSLDRAAQSAPSVPTILEVSTN